MADYDLIIIGAGIHGAAVARAASYDGYNVCIIEQYPEAGLATSNHSSKLIHGGLRYLESFQFKLVKECLHERSVLLKTAPQLVKLIPFHIPVYKNTKRQSCLIYLGLTLYRLLGGGTFKKISKSEWHSLDGLNTDNLKHVYQYHDGLTDDKKLTQAVLADAIKIGAEFLPENKIIKIELEEESVHVQTSQHKIISAKLLINASGPWVNDTLSKVTPSIDALSIDLVQGTHIVIPRTISKGIYYVEAADKRVVFAIPWKEHCLIGTTETPFNKKPEDCVPQKEEIEYLLTTWNQYFNDTLTNDDILESFAGLRVLPAADDSAFNRKRETILHTDNDKNAKIISIYGGKLTAHRATAEAVMEIVHKRLPGHDKTDTSVLSFES